MVRQSPEERKKLAKERVQDEAAAAKRLEEEKEKAEEEERQNQLKMKKKEEEDERDRKRAEKANARHKKKREEDAVKNAKEADEAAKKKQADDEALDAAIEKAAKNMNMDEDGDMESSGDEDGQPKKKKKRKDKEKKKARKVRKAATKKSDEAGGALPAGGAEIKSNLRAGKFSPIKPKRLQSAHNHKYKREHVTASKILTTDDKYLELALSCRGFMNEARKVDATFVLEPVDPKNVEGRVENLPSCQSTTQT
jgi:hypothetical protein